MQKQSISITETKFKLKTILIAVGETIGITEGLSRSLEILKMIAETITIQSFGKITQVFTRTLTFLVDALIGKILRTKIEFDSAIIDIFNGDSAIINLFEGDSSIVMSKEGDSAIINLTEVDSSVVIIMEFDSSVK